MNGPKMMAKLMDIQETATRKNRATDLKKYLVGDLDRIYNQTEEAIHILREMDDDEIIGSPVGPSSTDYEAWLKKRPAIALRFDNSGKHNSKLSQIAGYEIWRNAWLACEREHKIR